MASPPPAVRLSSNFDDPQAVPYFLWDAPLTIADLQSRLASAGEAERMRLLGKILREARDTDVWRFTTPAEVAAAWPKLQRHLGRRRAFWQFLLERWHAIGDEAAIPGGVTPRELRVYLNGLVDRLARLAHP